MAAKPKYPKALGACADLLFKMREKRLAADKVAAALKAEETELTEYIIANLPKGDGGAVGKTHKVVVKTEQVPQIDPENFMKLWDYAVKNKAPDLFQRRLNTTAVMDRVHAQKPKRVRNPDGSITEVYLPLPGTKFFQAVKLSLTKVK